MSVEETQLDLLCDSFVRSWRSGKRPCIEDYLAQGYAAERNALLLELLREELSLRSQSGERVGVEEYQARFPNHIETVAKAFLLFRESSLAGSTLVIRDSTQDTHPSQEFRTNTQCGLDRYRKLRELGTGAFGTVWLAEDIELRRHVAIKEPRADRMGDRMNLETYLSEARMLASFDHPHIVPVYDVGITSSGSYFIVSKWIDGFDLRNAMVQDPLSLERSAKVIADVADALQQTHLLGLVHRDIKPANILLDRHGHPYVTDFGLALQERGDARDQGIIGTPAYMSPEQARGEGHLVDGRSDIFSLGVVMYEMLTGTRPFAGQDSAEVLAQIMNSTPTPLRQLNALIPDELERICLKALSKRPHDRYQCAADLAEDLLHWKRSSDFTKPDKRDQETVKIIPKGLRSFDAGDCGFYLHLLPGVRDRDGIPESLRFWKNKIENIAREETFRIGLVYGPSGCGKSSLIKAGLLPRLGSNVVSIYLDSTPQGIETRLLHEVIKAIPDADRRTLTDALSSIRRNKLVPDGGKLLLVLDQFEQWLFSETDYANASLTKALAQCDGSTVQCIILVRDDFWLSINRFFGELDIPIAERDNSALVDLFDLDHATWVLGIFGVAYGRLPEHPEKWSQDQHEFLRRAVNGLAENRKVISVRLAVFADMMKTRPWTIEALREVGGIEGIGATFLEEIFGSKHAPIQHRKHEEAVKGLLASLLPPIGTEIKGSMRSAHVLQRAAGYADKPKEFHELVAILDQHLRLITPVDDKNSSGNDDSNQIEATGPSLNYQLSHDYLVPSLRQWLTEKQRETPKGRAELKLAQRAAAWTSKRENHQLPTLLEWVQIRRLTDKRRWTSAERAAMQVAWRVHLRNWGASMAAVLLIGTIIGYIFQQQQLLSQQQMMRIALESLQNTLGPAVPVNIQTLVAMNQPERIRSELKLRYAAARDPREKLSLAFGLARFGIIDSPYLVDQIDVIEDRDTANLIAALGSDLSGSIDQLRRAAGVCSTPELHRRKARLALAALGIGETTLPIDVCEFEGRSDHGARTWFIDEFSRWELDLRSLVETVQHSESPALRSAICLALGQIPTSRIHEVERKQIADLTINWFSLPDSSTHSAASWLMRQWEIPEPTIADAVRQVEGRNWFVNSQGATFSRISPPCFGYKPFLDPVERFRKELTHIDQMPDAEKQHPEIRVRRGLSLYQLNEFESALDEFDAVLATEGELAQRTREVILQNRLLSLARLRRVERLEKELAQWLAGDPNPSDIDRIETMVLLCFNQKEDAIKRLQQGLAKVDSEDRDALYRLALATACCADYGKPPKDEQQPWIDRALTLLERWTQDEVDRYRLSTEPDLRVLYEEPRFQALAAQPVATTRAYWIANQEVTVREFNVFLDDVDYQGMIPNDWKESRSNYSSGVSDDRPVVWVNWFDAVMYCNWLSVKEGRQPAYRLEGKIGAIDDKGKWLELDNWLAVESADGYRLPREMEWEHACRARTLTEWSPGDDDSLLAKYCQMIPSKGLEACGKKLPNAWGLHDMHGNALEWCWDNDLSYTYRIFRGGCWYHLPSISRSAYRDRIYPWVRRDDQGFRLAIYDDSPKADVPNR